MGLKQINKRIQKEICKKTIEKLNDDNLIDVYKNQKSVKKSIIILIEILEKNSIKK